MRKALIGLILAATAMTPVMAEAQRGGGENRRAEHYQRLEQRNQQRYGNQQQPRQARQEAPRQAQQAPQPQAQPVQVAQREGRRGGGDGNRGGNRGNRGGGNGGQTPSGYQRGWQGPNTPQNRQDANRYNRRAQENAIRYGTPAQRQDAIRDARQDGRRGDRDNRGNWNRGDRDNRGNWNRGDRDGRGGWNRGDRNWNRDWNRGWRNDRRYDWQSWRYRNRSAYHLGRYYAPYRGWNYNRFSIGFFLEPLFYSNRYWIGDPYQYRLPVAPYGTQWVRYYNDVLLVDIYTGEVVDAIYDFFW